MRVAGHARQRGAAGLARTNPPPFVFPTKPPHPSLCTLCSGAMISVRPSGSVLWPCCKLTAPFPAQAFFIFNQKGEVGLPGHGRSYKQCTDVDSPQVLISRLFRSDLK